MKAFLKRSGLLDPIKIALNSLQLIYGILVYRLSRKTPPVAYQALVGLYCLTQGKSNDFLSSAISWLSPPSKTGPAMGVLGDLDELKLSEITKEIEQKGYYVFPIRLSQDLCDGLLRIGSEEKMMVRGMEKKAHQVYSPTAPQGVRYDFNPEDLLKFPLVQEFLADQSLLALAKSYLKTDPVIDIVDMWWHTSFSKNPDKDAAQFYHFDMDRIKWLKFFFYVTDVNPESGPHCFVAESHRTGGTPKSLLQKGYARLTDEEVLSVFPESSIIEFNGIRGTIIAEDTRGLHKGKHVVKGDRLIFQLEYTNSLFGGRYDRDLLMKISKFSKKDGGIGQL